MIDIRRYKNTFANLNRVALFVRVSTRICLYVHVYMSTICLCIEMCLIYMNNKGN